jgi:hypothetical protein
MYGLRFPEPIREATVEYLHMIQQHIIHPNPTDFSYTNHYLNYISKFPPITGHHITYQWKQTNPTATASITINETTNAITLREWDRWHPHLIDLLILWSQALPTPNSTNWFNDMLPHPTRYTSGIVNGGLPRRTTPPQRALPPHPRPPNSALPSHHQHQPDTTPPPTSMPRLPTTPHPLNYNQAESQTRVHVGTRMRGVPYPVEDTPHTHITSTQAHAEKLV